MDALPPSELGLGIFPLSEAARLAQLDTRMARRWALGYGYRFKGEVRHSHGVMPLQLPVRGRERDLTFREMLTLRLVRGFRQADLGLPTIKRVAQIASTDYGEPLPFVSKRFRTDGRRIFLELKTRPDVEDDFNIPTRERRLIEVLTGQENFAAIVEPSLFANVDWHEDLASRWWPLGRDRHVILDPDVLFGAPHVHETRVPTATLGKAVAAEGNGPDAERAAADWYGVSPEAVRDAVDFETKWLKTAA